MKTKMAKSTIFAQRPKCAILVRRKYKKSIPPSIFVSNVSSCDTSYTHSSD